MPKEISSSRISRLNTIMEKLCSRHTIPGRKLRDTGGNGCSRTFQRDLRYLREEFGAEILYDKTSDTYSLFNRGTFVLFLSMRESQVQGIVAGLSMASHFLPHLKEDLSELWGKISATLPSRLIRQGEALGCAAVIATPVSSIKPQIFHLLIDAINQRVPVRFFYTSPYDKHPEPKERVASPWGVFFQAHAWYLWASHPDIPDGVTYRISRIDTPLMWPDGVYQEKPKGQDISYYASSCWYAYRGGPEVEIELNISPPLSLVIPETTWHPTQTIEAKEDGSAVLRATVSENALGSVARWVLASAPFVTVKEPERLAFEVTLLVDKLTKNLNKN